CSMNSTERIKLVLVTLLRQKRNTRRVAHYERLFLRTLPPVNHCIEQTNPIARPRAIGGIVHLTDINLAIYVGLTFNEMSDPTGIELCERCLCTTNRFTHYVNKLRFVAHFILDFHLSNPFIRFSSIVSSTF